MDEQNNKTDNKKLGKVIVKINSAQDVAEYIQAVGFLLSTIDEVHFTEQFNGRSDYFSYPLTSIHNAGRLIQDLSEGLQGRIDDMLRFCVENCGKTEGENNG